MPTMAIDAVPWRMTATQSTKAAQASPMIGLNRTTRPASASNPPNVRPAWLTFDLAYRWTPTYTLPMLSLRAEIIP